LDKSTQPKKSLGQHFLKSSAYCQRIVEFSKLTSTDTAVEIGPGTGELTDILLQRSSRVIAIEIDPEMLDSLRRRFFNQPSTSSRLFLFEADILQFNWKELLTRLDEDSAADLDQLPKLRVVGNLPYNISTRIMTSMIGLPQRFQSFTFMTQKEVAQRVLASPGSEDYGYFSVLMAYHFDRIKGFDVPPGAFYPPPKVTSHIFNLIPLQTNDILSDSQYQQFKIILQTAFRHRRKKLKNNLKSLTVNPDVISDYLLRAGIEKNARPQEVNLDQYLCVTRMLCFHP
jgi:16S rRNA (adenine1518-N6/adenine1519-N6)-dimethyltransferase